MSDQREYRAELEFFWYNYEGNIPFTDEQFEDLYENVSQYVANWVVSPGIIEQEILANSIWTYLIGQPRPKSSSPYNQKEEFNGKYKEFKRDQIRKLSGTGCSLPTSPVYTEE